MCDPQNDSWAITYFGPKHHLSAASTARRRGAAIVLKRRENDGELTHWIFDEIGARRFRWRAMSSKDHGASWQLDELMIGTRAKQSRS